MIHARVCAASSAAPRGNQRKPSAALRVGGRQAPLAYTGPRLDMWGGGTENESHLCPLSFVTGEAQTVMSGCFMNNGKTTCRQHVVP